MGERYLISDLHIGHEGALNFRREFRALGEMHEKIIDSWNETVKNKSDLVVILGDAFLDQKHANVLDKLKGKKWLVYGNHDTFTEDIYNHYFNRTLGMWITGSSHKNTKLLCTHIPVHPGELIDPANLSKSRGRYHANVHGHKHGEPIDTFGRIYVDVSCEKVDYRPKKVDDLIKETGKMYDDRNR